MAWFELLCQALRRDDLVAVDSGVPFGVRTATAIAWGEPAIEQRGETAWELTAGSAQGLEGRWLLRHHPDTRAVECSGSVRNAGRHAVEGLRELQTLDLPVGLTSAWGAPLVRTVNGARYIPTFFPPDDFRFRDRQLIRGPQAYTPFAVAALPDGRSSGRSLPCAILAGEAGDRGLALFYEWSGLWNIAIEQVSSPSAESTGPWAMRITAGVWGLALDLQPGEELPLPNLLLTGFDGDLEAGGNSLRRHIARHVAPELGGEPATPPVSFSHWPAFENDVSAGLLEPAVDACSQLGVEYFNVDASWFTGGFRRGIGNWDSPDTARFPDGVDAFGRYVTERGMRFGIWFEGEYANVESELHRAHPDWFLSAPAISPWATLTEGGTGAYQDGAWQLPEEDDPADRFALIDFGQAEARQWWIDKIVEVYERWNVRWIRWDFNQTPRPHWDHTAPAGRVGINQVNHVQGLYEVFDEVLRACPDLFVEQCAAGGNRIDLGTVRRGHTFWFNDHTTNTDVVRALQHGLNTVLPGIYANTMLCQPRFDYTDYDYLSHGAGSLGYSGLIWEAPASDRERYLAAVDRFKGYRHLLGAEYHRPTGNPQHARDHAQVAWTDGSQTLEMHFNPDGRPGAATVDLSSR